MTVTQYEAPYPLAVNNATGGDGVCGDVAPGGSAYGCTRDPGHKDRHEAGGSSGELYASWPQTASAMNDIERYAITLLHEVGEGAHDDANEDGVGPLDDTAHQVACALSVEMAHVIRDNPEMFLAWFRGIQYAEAAPL